MNKFILIAAGILNIALLIFIAKDFWLLLLPPVLVFELLILATGIMYLLSARREVKYPYIFFAGVNGFMILVYIVSVFFESYLISRFASSSGDPSGLGVAIMFQFIFIPVTVAYFISSIASIFLCFKYKILIKS